MSPIDDELRAALHGRAQVLAPSTDPLAGIERRAKRIQRNRIGAAVTASALAVVAVAAVVPALQQTSATPRQDVPRVAATLEPTPAPQQASYALDPEAPWTYRGDPQLAVQGDLDAYTVQWAATHGVLTDDVDMTPLFGQVYEPSATPEVVYLVTQRSTGDHWWGVAQATESGPELLCDRELLPGQQALAAALPGDEQARLLVVAAPDVSGINYGPDDSGAVSAMAELSPGVATVAMLSNPPDDYYVVVDRSGREISRGPAPDLAVQNPDPPRDTAVDLQALDPESPWGVRGDRSLVTDGQLDALGQGWAARNGISAVVETVPLYVQRYEADAGIEVVYLVRSGDGPWTWGVATLGEGGWSWYAEHEITRPLRALAAALPGDEGDERLLVVAAPSMGGGMYAADGSDFAPMTDLAPGVFLTSISPGDADDEYMVLDGNGDPDDPVFRGPAPDYQNAG